MSNYYCQVEFYLPVDLWCISIIHSITDMFFASSLILKYPEVKRSVSTAGHEGMKCGLQCGMPSSPATFRMGTVG